MANSGAKKHSDRLNRMAKQTAQKVLQALYVSGQQIEITAERSITEGSVSGAGHVPSAPGQPPNANTRLLDTSIETTIEARGNNPVVHVTSNAPYSSPLEFGTSKMAERPFMRPAAEKHRGDLTARVKNATVKISR